MKSGGQDKLKAEMVESVILGNLSSESGHILQFRRVSLYPNDNLMKSYFIKSYRLLIHVNRNLQ